MCITLAGAHGIIVVYDITDKESFKAIDTWMSEIEKHASDSVNKILVGNKCDETEKRGVSYEEGKVRAILSNLQELADHYNIKFLETSAKMAQNIEEAFTVMTREIKSRVIQPTGSSRGTPGNSPVIEK